MQQTIKVLKCKRCGSDAAETIYNMLDGEAMNFINCACCGYTRRV